VTRIKICGLTRVEDALIAANAGADAIGLVFYEQSSRHISIGQAAVLVAMLPPFVTVVGLFVNPKVEFVRQVMASVPLDMLQFHGDEPAKFCVQFSRPYLKAIRVKAGVDLVQCTFNFRSAKGLLLDAHVDGLPGGTGTSFDWSLIPQKLPLPVILSGGLTAKNVASAIKTVQPYAVDVSSGVEAEGVDSGKGIKDAVKITAFISEVKRVDV